MQINNVKKAIHTTWQRLDFYNKKMKNLIQANWCVVLVQMLYFYEKKQKGTYYRDNLIEYTMNVFKRVCFLGKNSW